MNRNVYCIFDKVAEEANFPFPQKNDACAIRAFTEVINRDVRKVKQLKVKDYSLYLLGTFDTESMAFDLNKKFIMDGDQVEEIDYPEEPAAAPIPPQMLASMFKGAMPQPTPPTPPKKGFFGRRK